MIFMKLRQRKLGTETRWNKLGRVQEEVRARSKSRDFCQIILEQR